MTVETISRNDDENIKEDCRLCFGKGWYESVQVISDGENFHQIGDEFSQICPRCYGEGKVKADYVVTKKETP